MHQCDAYEISAMKKEPVLLQENPAYGQIGSV